MQAPKLGVQNALVENTVPAVAFAKGMNEREQPDKPLFTGRYFAVLKEGVKNFKNTNQVFKKKAGLQVASFSDFADGAFSPDQIIGADVLVYDHLNIALVGSDEQSVQVLEANSEEFIMIPERVVYAPNDLQALSAPGTQCTWGLDATAAAYSKYTGKGVKVAVLDTGFDFNHPDFKSRTIASQSFVPNETADDKHGHGTHCIGTACGYEDVNGLRYGIACDSEIYAGKVLSNAGSGAQQYILDGITWAADNGCKVISMSLGSKVLPGMSYDIIYERAAQYANSKGAVVVAAVGNDSYRSYNVINPVGSPADCPSILGVGAVDQSLNIADFSNRSINGNSHVDLVGPGVGVYSSFPMNTRYRNLSGTSMATPHVAGILALFWEKYPTYNYQQITLEMLKFAKRLPLASVDAGVGLVIAP